MKIGVYTNPVRDKDHKITKKLLKEAERLGVDVTVLDADAADLKNKFSEYNIIMALGGDGTVLKIAAAAAEFNTAVLGINTGNLGFLTEIEPDFIADALLNLKEGNYFLENRIMLSAETDKKEIIHALNEIVCTREDLSRISKLDVFFKNGYVDTFWSDGVMISTPTGSTAYSLSAGGPILAPDLRGFSLTAINPHSLHSRPMVISDTEVITVKNLIPNSKNLIIADGNKKIPFSEKVTIKKSQHEAVFVRFKPVNFYYRLVHKLNKWSTTEIDKDE